jgi:hypothetical protein
MEDICVYDEETGEPLYETTAVYLARDSKDITIEFSNDYIKTGE